MLSIVSRVMQQVHSLLIDPMTSQRLERIRSLIESAGSTYVSVQFTKKDGSHRQLTFNPADHNDIKGTGDVSKVDENIFRVRDNSKQQWRSFDARRVISIKVRGTTTEFND
jgi:hypothetical protein|tara:strand:+ start:1312 stop:1644 length:333 start_codon:yes stop_codon:yes gene_type:complete